MSNVVEIRDLNKSYGKTTVVHEFNLSIKKSHIYGLIGPNGAGKTTVMKMLAGLTRQQSGEISLFGDSSNLDENRKRISFMIEAPYLDGSMTAYENMQYIRYARGVADSKRIDTLLEFVGLADTKEKQVKNFSLGMRQRLGIGMALLPSPEILVLDEPVNGLDPEGIVDVRNMLKKLCEEENITILISSHLLSELSELCTDFAFMNRGVLIECVSKEELENKCRNYIAIKTNDIFKTVAVLEQKLNVKQYKVVENKEICLYERLDDVENVSKTITDNDIILTQLYIKGDSLEDYYLSKIEKEALNV